MSTPWKRREVIGGQTLLLGDCLEIMPALGRVDAVVTDPPYGIDRDKGVGVGGARVVPVRRYNGGWDSARPDSYVFDRVRAISDHQIIWGGQFFADMLPPMGKWLFWDKCQIMPSFGDGELAWSSLPGDAVKQFTYNGSGYHAKEKDRVHPTQKPVALMEWCLGFLPNAQTILDPFMGSGTTLVACQRLGRNGIGVEIDKDYFEIACRRVDEATRQPDLFIRQDKANPETPLLPGV